VSRRKRPLPPLADPARKPWVKRALNKRDYQAEREALKDPVKRQRMLERLREAIKQVEELSGD
jgi:hypothetical protein